MSSITYRRTASLQNTEDNPLESKHDANDDDSDNGYYYSRCYSRSSDCSRCNLAKPVVHSRLRRLRGIRFGLVLLLASVVTIIVAFLYPYHRMILMTSPSVVQQQQYEPKAGRESIVLLPDNHNHDEPKSSISQQHATPSKEKKRTKKNIQERDKPITRIALIGERNSGTNWMVNELDRCFNQTSLKLYKRLTRYKHWFQHEGIVEKKGGGSTLVLAVFRDPYFWVEAMRQKPHHAPKHLYLDWHNFVTKPWTMKRVGRDLEIEGVHDKNGREQKVLLSDDVNCQENFRYHQVVTCHKYPYPETKRKYHFSEHHPVYELRNDGSGEPYSSIVDLRRDKILNFLDTAQFADVEELIQVKYEDMIRQGTGFVIKRIEKLTGMKAHCEPTPPQKNRKKRELDDKYVKWISDHVDWDVENRIGYMKRKRG